MEHNPASLCEVGDKEREAGKERGEERERKRENEGKIEKTQ